MCKASLPPPPTNEVADQIKNSTSVDNSWSFINLHLPSTITTTVIIIIILIAAWILLRLYNRFSKARPPADQTRPGQTPTTLPTLTPAWPSAPPAPWPSTTTAPARTSTSLTLDMDTLMKALRPDSTPPVQASGPPPNLAHLP